jgi:hypothetical protein
MKTTEAEMKLICRETNICNDQQKQDGRVFTKTHAIDENSLCLRQRSFEIRRKGMTERRGRE